MHPTHLAEVISLNGAWRFSLAGHSGLIQTPGCWEAQGYPKNIDGPAHYSRTVFIPAGWRSQRTWLEFDALSYAARVRVNGVEAGSHQGLWTPFALDIGDLARYGADNLIEIEVYKPGETYPLRQTLAGFLPDVAVAFGGIWQSARLRNAGARFAELWLQPDYVSHVVRVHGAAIAGVTSPDAHLQVTASDMDQVVARIEQPLLISDGARAAFDVSLHLADAKTWSPAHPQRYTVTAAILAGSERLAETSEQVGFRQLSADADRLRFNGQSICLRGVLHWGWNPEQIAPVYTAEQVRSEFTKLRQLGFNMVKVCLVIPNRTFYDVADEMGMLIWQEWPLWMPAVQPAPELIARAPGEYTEYMALVHHHPSIVVYSLGCELQSLDQNLIADLNRVVRSAVGDVLFCDNSGSNEVWSGGQRHDYADFTDYHIYSDLHDFEPLVDHYRRDWTRPRPWLSGEFNDSDTFRDLHELIAANDGKRPWWTTRETPLFTWRPEVEAMIDELDLLDKADLHKDAQELVRISYSQSLAIRKTILESLRRRAGIGGYVITGVRDAPIFTSGILDDLGRPKWTAEEFLPFNQDRVLTYDVDRRSQWPIHGERLDRLDRACFWAGETARLYIILSNAGAPLPPECSLKWELIAGGHEPILGGTIDLPALADDPRPQEVATLQIAFPSVTCAQEYDLRVQIVATEPLVANRWPLWAFPKPDAWPEGVVLDDPSGVLDALPALLAHAHRVEASHAPDTSLPRLVVSTALSPWVRKYLAEGGAVLLLQQNTLPLPARRGPFWREAIKLFYDHPLWQRFPHRGYTDMQFFGIATDVTLAPDAIARTFSDAYNITPLLKRLDAREFHVHDYLVEAQVGQGRLLACTLRLQGGAGQQPLNPVRNIAGYSLLWEMVRYLAAVEQAAVETAA